MKTTASSNATILTASRAASRRNKIIAIACALVIALVGYVLFTLRAAGPFASAEAEKGTLASVAKVVDDAAASGGKAVQYGATPTPPPPTTDATKPNGPTGTWNLKFNDEFNGAGTIDRTKWTDASGAEADQGHGNLSNQQLEWNQAANCTVAGGELTMTAKREAYTSASGKKYNWTSCLMASSPSYNFKYGYIEERATLPGTTGFWPAFWTWQSDGVNAWLETDAYEFYSVNHSLLYLTSHINDSSKGCDYKPPFDPSTGYHIYGVDIQANSTTRYFLCGDTDIANRHCRLQS